MTKDSDDDSDDDGKVIELATRRRLKGSPDEAKQAVRELVRIVLELGPKEAFDMLAGAMQVEFASAEPQRETGDRFRRFGEILMLGDDGGSAA